MTTKEVKSRVLQTNDSSFIQKVEYNFDNNQLTVLFDSGSIWQYDNVPLELYNEMITSESIGAIYNIKIRNKFESYKLHILI